MKKVRTKSRNNNFLHEICKKTSLNIKVTVSIKSILCYYQIEILSIEPVLIESAQFQYKSYVNFFGSENLYKGILDIDKNVSFSLNILKHLLFKIFKAYQSISTYKITKINLNNTK